MDTTAESLLTTGEKAKPIVDTISYPSVDAESRNLGTVARSVAEDYRERYPAATVVTPVEYSVAVACTERIGTAIEQLVENAIEYDTLETPRPIFASSSARGTPVSRYQITGSASRPTSGRW